MPTVIPIDLKTRIGDHLGHGAWQTITQEPIDLFAEATGDHQWIHVDPERAQAGPLGGPIAHGYPTLSRVPRLLDEVLTVEGISMAINCGRGPGGRGAADGVTLNGVEEVSGGVRVALETLCDGRDAQKPSCVAEIVFRFYR